jgi:hypothetical protein
MNCTNKKFVGSFAKNTGLFMAGFLGMIGLINVFVWMFGKTVAIWLTWTVLALGWIGYITFSSERSMTVAEQEALKAYWQKDQK